MTTEAPVLDAAKLVLFDNWFGPAVRVRSLAFLSEPENRGTHYSFCLLYTSPSPRDGLLSRMPSSA